ncbi:hypothetical protein GCK72_002120 [Caenorhabditis remanei]|nr:hypothetical protein GCK72_002120 [Caenorhabditis remanei]KAF1770302.1 hypothetical protein GCK72_002120 [Caenorhabditis remanei]
MWSLGCIFAEIASTKPLFPGECEISQLFKIFEIVGTPNNKNWPGVADLPHYKAVFPQWSFDLNKLEEMSCLTGHGLDVLQEILRYPPERRLTAKGALSHRYFLQNEFTQNRPTVTELIKQIRMHSRASSSSSRQEKSTF